MSWAWEITDEETGSVVVFSATEHEAARLGASELASEPEAVEVRRLPEYDKYAEQGYVPIKVLYEGVGDKYWVFGCWQCDRTVSIADDDDEDDEGHPLEPVFEEKRLFCCAKCQEGFYHALKQKERDRAAAKEYLLQNFPGIKISSVCGGDAGYAVSIDFTFPGGKHWVRWNSDEQEIVRVTQMDLDAWTAFSRTIKLLQEA